MTRIAVAAALSVGLHLAGAAVLLLRPTPAPAPLADKPVTVEVMRLAAVMGPKPKAAVAQPVVAAKKTRSSPREQTRGDAVVATSEPTASAPGPNESPVPEAPEAPAAPVAEAPAPVAATPVVLDTGALSRRLQEVAVRCYPAAARRFRQTGEAEVKFCLDGAGTLASAAVSKSSGSELLDQAARGCVVPGAAPFGAEAHGHCFTLPVRFGAP